MKKIILLSAISLLAVSCFKNTGYEASYTLYADFSTADTFFEQMGAVDSVLTVPSFSYGPVAFFNSTSDDENASAVNGGWSISKKCLPLEILYRGEGGTIDPELEALMSPFAVSDTTDALPNKGKVAFLVFHEDQSSMPEHDMQFLQATVGTCSPSYAAFNTTIDVANYFKSQAVEGDYFNVVITGYSGTSKTGSVEVCLADRRSGKNELVYDWKTVEISDLGAVEYIDFTIDCQMSAASQDKDYRYFCFDNFIASIYIKQMN